MEQRHQGLCHSGQTGAYIVSTAFYSEPSRLSSYLANISNEIRDRDGVGNNRAALLQNSVSFEGCARSFQRLVWRRHYEEKNKLHHFN